MIRVLYLTNRLAPAGAETFLLHRMRVLDRARFSPYVAAVRSGGDLQGAFEEAGVPTRSFGAGKRFDPGVFQRMYSFLREERIAIIEAHVWYACLLARVVGAAARVPVIITNEQDVRDGKDAHRRDVVWAADLTMPLSDACVRITHATEATFERGTPALLRARSEHRVIPNGVDLTRVAEVAGRVDRAKKRAEIGLAPGAFVIGNVARLHPSKGQSDLLRAFARVRSAVPEARLVIIGWGVLEDALRAEAAELGVQDHVSFLGKRLDVYEWLPVLDVFAFPSIHEGQGIAILEAMGAGVPVVATDVDGIPEMVKHERTGLAVSPRDPEALAAAILRLRSEVGLAARLAEGAAAFARERYSIEAAGRAYEALYDELLAKARSRGRAIP